MSKTPLASLVRRLARKASATANGVAPRRVTRREFIQRAGAIAALASIGPAALSFADSPKPGAETGKRIAIVGGGLAGLRAAWELKRRGVAATVYEASSRLGGRIFSVPGALSPDLTTEFGGEFINSDHEDMLALAREFGLDLLDTQAPGEEEFAEAIHLRGKPWSGEELIEELREPFAKMAEDYDSLGDAIDWKNDGGARELDALSLAAYIDSRGATGVGRELLRIAFTAEFGAEPEEQSCLNMLFMLGLDLSEGFDVLGESDERYKIRGGNDLVAKALASQLDKGSVRQNRRLARVETDALGTHLLTLAATDGAEERVEADVVPLRHPVQHAAKGSICGSNFPIGSAAPSRSWATARTPRSWPRSSVRSGANRAWTAASTRTAACPAHLGQTAGCRGSPRGGRHLLPGRRRSGRVRRGIARRGRPPAICRPSTARSLAARPHSPARPRACTGPAILSPWLLTPVTSRGNGPPWLVRSSSPSATSTSRANIAARTTRAT
jgi:hypothetical protein